MKGFFEGSFDRGTFRTAPAHVQGARLKAGAPRAWYRGYQRPDAGAIVRTACAALLLLATSSLPAHAVCNSPPGGAGDQIYNSTHNVMQYCNGNQWIAMGSGGGGGGGSDTLGDLSCNSGESIEFDGTNWNCVGGKVSRAGDTMTGTLDVAAPTSSGHAATKGYVDTALAGIAGASGGGGNACYYTDSSCGSGFNQMPGTYEGSNICCTGSGGLGDDTPAPFDFPASPSLAYNAGHTWDPIEITDFDSASVSIQTTGGAGTGEFRVCADAACASILKGWRTTSTGIASGNYLQIRIGAATAAIRSSNAKITVTVGSMSDDAPITSSVSGPYFIAFVTSQSWTGNLGGVSGADAKCQAAATAAGFFGTFRAWLSESNSSTAPATRFENAGTAAKFVKPQGVNGTKIADSWADLTDGSLDSALNYTETGASANTTTYTNVSSDGTRNSSVGECSNWTSGAFGNPEYGNSGSTTATWTEDTAAGTCTTARRIFCFQTVLPN